MSAALWVTFALQALQIPLLAYAAIACMASRWWIEQAALWRVDPPAARKREASEPWHCRLMRRLPGRLGA